jgi:hypothetical protein
MHLSAAIFSPISLVWVKKTYNGKEREFKYRNCLGRNLEVLYFQTATHTSEKDSTRIKKCAFMQALDAIKSQGVFNQR